MTTFVFYHSQTSCFQGHQSCDAGGPKRDTRRECRVCSIVLKYSDHLEKRRFSRLNDKRAHITVATSWPVRQKPVSRPWMILIHVIMLDSGEPMVEHVDR